METTLSIDTHNLFQQRQVPHAQCWPLFAKNQQLLSPPHHRLWDYVVRIRNRRCTENICVHHSILQQTTHAHTHKHTQFSTIFLSVLNGDCAERYREATGCRQFLTSPGYHTLQESYDTGQECSWLITVSVHIFEYYKSRKTLLSVDTVHRIMSKSYNNNWKWYSNFMYFKVSYRFIHTVL